MPRHEDPQLPVSSSVAPEFPPEKEQLFWDILNLMNESGIGYAVSGAFALHQHTGIWRQTKDLDLFIPHEHVKEAMDFLEEHGYECECRDPVWLNKVWRGDYFVDLITGMSNAVLRVDQSWIDRSVPANVLGIPSRVLAPEELLASKFFVVRRERFDGADVVHIIHATNGDMDWRRVLEIVNEHWEMALWALIFYRYVYPAYAHEIPRWVWNDLLGRLQYVLDHPTPNSPFRGSLIDENMFMINVKEWGEENIIEQYRARHRKRALIPEPPSAIKQAGAPAPTVSDGKVA